MSWSAQTAVANDGVLSWDPAGWIAAAVIVLAFALMIYIVIPERARGTDADSSRVARALSALASLRNLTLYLVLLGFGVAYIVNGNATGRIVGVALLGVLSLLGVRVFR